ncbi:MAG TPA: hypothetical protein VGQ90_15750 [Stellaceae bacterium]|nr:hypothetical protein [Stellaceae bacterium]
MLSARKLVAIGVALVIAATGVAIAQTMPDHHSMGSASGHPMGPEYMQEMMRQHQGMIGGHSGMHGASTTPTLPGQDAFGAIQEVVRILDADPKTDWSKVDLEALRQHLIDMNEVTLKADVAAKPIEGGLEVAVTGSGRTLLAIQRMIPAHAQSINGRNGWRVTAAALPNGEILTVAASDPKEIQHIRGLGFIGLLASGAHHQPHHLAMAKGAFDHEHAAHAR